MAFTIPTNATSANRIKNCPENCNVDREKAMGIVQEIVKQIKSEHDDLKHGVTLVTTSLEIAAVNERYGYVCITWKYRIRDTG